MVCKIKWENICYYFPWSITHGASLPIYEWPRTYFWVWHNTPVKIKNDSPTKDKYEMENEPPMKILVEMNNISRIVMNKEIIGFE